METKSFLFSSMIFLAVFVGTVILSINVLAAIIPTVPGNYSWSTNSFSNQKFTFSIDNSTGIDANCSIYMAQTGGLVNQYGIVNTTSQDPDLDKFAFSNSTAINLTANNANISGGYASGAYYWNITCVNNSLVGAGVVTTISPTRWFLYDGVAPFGNISSPSNNSFTNTRPLNLNGTINDSYSGPNLATTLLQFSNSTGACWQWNNNTWGSCNPTPTAPGPLSGDLTLLTRTLQVNTSNFNVSYAVGKNLSNTTNSSFFSDDRYIFVIYAGDTPFQGQGNPNYGIVNISFVYDATLPSAVIHSVNLTTNNSWTSKRLLVVNLTALDGNLNYYNITLYNSTSNSANTSLQTSGNSTAELYNITAPRDDTYTVNLTVVDNATNINSSAVIFYIRVDATIPVAVINNISKKVNNSWTNSRQLEINFTASDTNIKNWSIFVYNSTDSFNNSPSGWNLTYYESNTSAVYNFTAPGDGTYWVNLTVTDNATTVNTTSLFYIKVDATSPSVGTPSFSGISSSGATLSVEMGETNLNACTYSGGSSGTLSCSGGTCSASLSGLSASIIHSYSVSCTDLAGNSATGASNSFMTSSSSSGSGSGGSGGGSSSGVAGQFTKKVWSSLYAGETATLGVKEGDGIGVTEVSFKVDKTSYGVIGDVKKVEKTEVPAEIAGKKVHNYIKIMVTGAIKEENTKERTVLFKVAKKWLADNLVSKDKLALYRYADSKWNTLPTKLTQEDDITVYYSAETPGFSYFAIAEGEAVVEAPAPVKEEKPVEEVPVVEAPVEEDSAEAATPTLEKSNTWLWVVLVVVIAAIIAGIYFWPKKNKRGF